MVKYVRQLYFWMCSSLLYLPSLSLKEHNQKKGKKNFDTNYYSIYRGRWKWLIAAHKHIRIYGGDAGHYSRPICCSLRVMSNKSNIFAFEDKGVGSLCSLAAAIAIIFNSVLLVRTRNCLSERLTQMWTDIRTDRPSTWYCDKVYLQLNIFRLWR